MPTRRRSCISTVSFWAWSGVGRAPPTSLLIPHPASTAQRPPLQPWKPLSAGPSLFVCVPVKVPTRRTFMDPQSWGDPLQAVHLFAKELDARSVTVEKSLGAGKPGPQEALSLGSAASAPAPPTREVLPPLQPLRSCEPASTPRPSQSWPIQTAAGRRSAQAFVGQ